MAKLSPQQLQAVTLLSLPKMGGLTYEQIADKVGVTDRTIRNWRNNDKFNEELKRQIVRNTIDDLPEIMDSLKDHIVKQGNAAMLRTLLQAHSMLTEKVEVSSDNKTGDVDSIRAEIERLKDGR